jgi:hypothetical protein
MPGPEAPTPSSRPRPKPMELAERKETPELQLKKAAVMILREWVSRLDAVKRDPRYKTEDARDKAAQMLVKNAEADLQIKLMPLADMPLGTCICLNNVMSYTDEQAMDQGELRTHEWSFRITRVREGGVPLFRILSAEGKPFASAEESDDKKRDPWELITKFVQERADSVRNAKTPAEAQTRVGIIAAALRAEILDDPGFIAALPGDGQISMLQFTDSSGKVWSWNIHLQKTWQPEATPPRFLIVAPITHYPELEETPRIASL